MPWCLLQANNPKERIMADKGNLKDWLVIAAVFGPDKALTIYSVVVWGSVVAFLLALGDASAEPGGLPNLWDCARILLCHLAQHHLA